MIFHPGCKTAFGKGSSLHLRLPAGYLSKGNVATELARGSAGHQSTDWQLRRNALVASGHSGNFHFLMLPDVVPLAPGSLSNTLAIALCLLTESSMSHYRGLHKAALGPFTSLPSPSVMGPLEFTPLLSLTDELDLSSPISALTLSLSRVG